MSEMSAFKNYTAGEPTCRLYIKNLAKHVDEKVVEGFNLFRSPTSPSLSLFFVCKYFLFCLLRCEPITRNKQLLLLPIWLTSWFTFNQLLSTKHYLCIILIIAVFIILEAGKRQVVNLPTIAFVTTATWEGEQRGYVLEFKLLTKETMLRLNKNRKSNMVTSPCRKFFHAPALHISWLFRSNESGI